ncbi:hypothetical protein Tco_0743905 [Tanacetum coccineum]
MSDHDDDASDINNDNAQPQQQQNIQPQIITTVSNNNAKFPYLKKDEYEAYSPSSIGSIGSIEDLVLHRVAYTVKSTYCIIGGGSSYELCIDTDVLDKRVSLCTAR